MIFSDLKHTWSSEVQSLRGNVPCINRGNEKCMAKSPQNCQNYGKKWVFWYVSFSRQCVLSFPKILVLLCVVSFIMCGQYINKIKISSFSWLFIEAEALVWIDSCLAKNNSKCKYLAPLHMSFLQDCFGIS